MPTFRRHVSRSVNCVPLCYTVPDRREADTGMMISFLLVAAALTAGSLLIDTAGDWVDEKTGRWRTGGLIALLIGIAASTWITTTAPQAARQSAGR